MEAQAWADRVHAASLAQTAGCASVGVGGSAVSALGEGEGGCFGQRGPSFLRGRALEANDATLLQLTHSPGLARLAAQAMNVSRVRLYQASAFIKNPGDAPSPWHQDAAACPLGTDKLVTLWLALDDVPAQAGPLVFARGSHLPKVPLPSLRDLPPSQRLDNMRLWSTAEVRNLTGLTVTKPLGLTAGDATLHLGWTLHAAPANTHSLTRRALAITYFADGSKVHPNLLAMDEEPADSTGGARGAASSIAFKGEDGKELKVHLLSDDYLTWKEWLHKKPPILIPGQAVRDNMLTPLLWDEMWGTNPRIPV